MYRFKALLVLSFAVSASAAQGERREAKASVYGFEMHYVEAGEGEPVILLHGLWGGRNEWEHNIDAIASDFRVIVVDQIGFWDSDKPSALYDNHLLSQFLAGFMESLGLSKAHLVGHAMGATTATQFAVTYPDRVAKIVLVDGVGYQRDSAPPEQTPARLRFSRMASGSTLRTTKALLLRRVGNDALVTDAWVEQAYSMWLGSSLTIRGMLSTGGSVPKETMKTIDAPTLVVWGENDEISDPSQADEPLDDIAGAKKYIIPDAGHLAQFEQPDTFNRVVRDFLKTGNVPE